MVEVARTDDNMIPAMLDAAARRRRSARSATRCVPSGASTANPPASEGTATLRTAILREPRF